ncbi:MAG: DUF2974 domain-containing protein [Eubacteriales bacterium]|nr:DUF2974 domain-containing protein [Eubacteriales bacterium]
MATIQEHAVAVGELTLEQRPFDALDSLILSQLIYMPMEGGMDNGERLTVKEAWAFLREHCDPQRLDQFQQKRYRLSEVCAGLKRYQSWMMHDYVNHIDDELETQFCAATYDMEDGSSAVSFRGTDLTIAGWKEDFNMSYMVVPAQKEAVTYLERIAAVDERPLSVCGHSKGGNLSVYSGAFCNPEVQRRLQAVYSFDGPGMYEEFLQSEEYNRVKDRIQSFIPQSSVVGMLMNYHPVYTVVRAHSVGILQHDAMTWQVENGDFVQLEGLDMTGKITDETLHTWLATMDGNDRRTLVKTLYQVVDASQAELVTDLSDDWRDTAMKALEALREIDPEMRKNVRTMLHSLFSTGASEVVRMILPNAARNGHTLLDWGKDKSAAKEREPAEAK